jgi:hypothetical protein
MYTTRLRTVKNLKQIWDELRDPRRNDVVTTGKPSRTTGTVPEE